MKTVAALAFVALLAGTAHAETSPQEKSPEPRPQPAVASNRFDGDWTIRMDCPAGGDPGGAQAFSAEFPGSVLNGQMYGSSGQQGAVGTVQVEGTIQPDGTAPLQARGRTSVPAVATGQVPPGTPFSYDVVARFDPDRMHGVGQRVQDRVCNFDFMPR